MKIGASHIMVRFLCCVLVLFPHYALAGAVAIPGFSGTVTLHAPVPVAAVSAPVTVNIPGFYGPSVAPPPPTQLPVVLQNGQNGVQNAVQGATVSEPSQNQLVIQQTQQQAIINWASFNVGANATVQFLQQGKDQYGNAWVGTALNRIWDNNPSLIFGKITADGRIYLINQNGILFGPGSQVNVNSLVASALNIHDADFLSNTLHFTMEDYQNSSGGIPNYLAAVSNLGEIDAVDGGYVFLMAPRVENFASINAPAGQVGMVAGTDVQLTNPSQGDTSRSGFYVIINDDFINAPKSSDANFGRAVNQASGQLTADGGVVGMYGNNVDQWGIIRAVTAFQNNKGQVELKAASKITTGANSSIELPVDDSLDPSTGLPPTINDTFDIQPVVTMQGLNGANASANEIDLAGKITAPAGQVTLNAVNRVYMESGSSIDVSGVTAVLPVAVLENVKLTSVQLADYYDQKGGVLQGQNITTPVSSGSSIGDLSQLVLTRDKTAQERLVGGYVRKYLQHDPTGQTPDQWVYEQQTGNIAVNVTNGDIIVKQGATLNIAGGVIDYQSGLVNSTKLLSGTTIYDISNAPQNLPYSSILGDYIKTYYRYGIQQSYTGLYYGGAAPVKTYVQGYQVGGDAGTVSLSAPTVVLDGQVTGGVTRGTYQNTWTNVNNFSTDTDYFEALMLSKAQGLEAPKAGSLNISASNISVLSDTDPRPDLRADSPLLTGQPTLLSAKSLNNADLGSIKLIADLVADVKADAALVLQPGGTFDITARLIDFEGQVKVPAGTINLFAVQNLTSEIDPTGSIRNNNPTALPNGLTERIVLGTASVLDASGERIDNSQAGIQGSSAVAAGRTGGGTIAIEDKTDLGDGVFIQQGARVDVSGGYTISQNGTVTGGSAGSLIIQGSNIELDGNLRGYALADPNGKLQGGSITLASSNITVAPAASIPEWYTWSGFDPLASSIATNDPLKGQFYLSGNRFDETGFTQITLQSQHDLTIDQNTIVAPSLVRLNNPVASRTGTTALVNGQAIPGSPDLILLGGSDSYMAGPSKFTAAAGTAFNAPNGGLFHGNLQSVDPTVSTLSVLDGANIQTTPGGSISLSAASVAVQGTLDSPAGTIQINATNGNLLIGNGADILAVGYNQPDPSSTPNGFSLNYLPMNGGNVSLTVTAAQFQPDTGNLTIDPSAKIDVSGSDAVSRTVLLNGKLTTYMTAGSPGSVSLSYGRSFNLNGEVVANNAKLDGLDGVSGGTVVLTYSYPTSFDPTQAQKMSISGYIGQFLNSGFDDLTFRSNYTINFDAGDVGYVIGRKLTLDAPDIIGIGNNVTLSAPWIVLTNTSTFSPPVLPNPTIPAAGNLALSAGGFIDVIGNIQLDGFNTVTLKTDQDIRLSQVLYNDNFITNTNGSAGTVYPGTLMTTGSLILDAARLYPGAYYEYDRNGNAVFPNIYSDYIVQAGGTIILQHTAQNPGIAVDTPIYSAGGNLTIKGLGGIDVKNGVTVAAPLGTITLTTGSSPASGSRIFLEDGSILTTAGDPNFNVNYGEIDANNNWLVQDKSKPSQSLTATFFTAGSLPNKGITLNADQVISQQGSVMNVSGGGSVFAYTFEPGVQGTVDPLSTPGTYIIFKAGSFPMPGPAIYLQGGGGLSAGMYTLLNANNPQNARYAFLPGAYIIQAQSGTSVTGPGSLSKDGYPLVVGYSTVADTSIVASQPQVYTVRTAADVLNSEGSYVKPAAFVSGNGGSIALKGNTMILDGQLSAAPLNGFQGGQISLTAANITVISAANAVLGDYFNFNTSFTDPAHPELQQLLGNLTVSASGLQGFREVDLGDTSSTNNLIIQSTAGAPTVLSASNISLAAKNQITIGENASLLAPAADQGSSSGDGVIMLTTPGTLDIQSGSTLHATNAVSLNANNVAELNGTLQSDGGKLTLNSSTIFFDDGKQSATGLHLTQDQWNTFTGFRDITLASNSGSNPGIQFMESVNLSAANSLTLDASQVINTNPNANGAIAVTLTAPTINIKNSGSSWTGSTIAASGAATFTATASSSAAGGVGTLNVGDGDVLFSNFTSINLTSQNDLSLVGKGSLSTGSADLTMTAARVTAANTARTVTDTTDNTVTTALTPADFVIYAGANYENEQNNLNPTNKITIIGNGNSPGPSSTEGGAIKILGTSITDQGGVIQADGGTVTMVTTGTDGIHLQNGSQILARGTGDAPGGVISLSAVNGGIVIDSSSLIDVSAGYTTQSDGTKVSQGDAGLISLEAPQGGVTLNGVIIGAAQGGKGGSFVLDTNEIDSISAWTGKLSAKTDSQGNVISGGFTESLDLRARNNDVKVDSDVQANHFILTADGGGIDITGSITTNSPGGGIELYAMNDLTLELGSTLRAVATQSDFLQDPNVLLSSTQGSININGTINVSDQMQNASGSIYLRALRNGSDVNINITGTLTGASEVYAEAYQPYNSSTITQTMFTDAASYYASNTAVTRLAAYAPGGTSTFHLLPGIEVDSAGDINPGAWDLTNVRFGSANDPGVLTIRAGGNLNITGNLTDAPASEASGVLTAVTSVPSGRNSWSYNLVAGADLSSADPMAVIVNTNGSGNLNISNQAVVYTESAPISFASGGDTLIGVTGQSSLVPGIQPGYMISQLMNYNLASFSGSVRGNVGHDLTVAGAIQTATGDIDVTVGGDLNLLVGSNANNIGIGAIRTTGQLSGSAASEAMGQNSLDPIPINPTTGQPYNGITLSQSDRDMVPYAWRYADGGNISIDVGGTAGKLGSSGNWVTADNGGWDHYSLIQVNSLPNRPSYGLFSADYSYGTAGLATMGGGNLNIHTGSDFLAQAGTFGAGNLTIYADGDIKGRFLNKDGHGEIHAMGNFGSFDKRTQIELFDSVMNVTAQGEMQIGAVVNPTLASDKINAYRNSFVQVTYTDETAISLTAGTDITLAGKSPYYSNYLDVGYIPTAKVNETILPATVNAAAGGNIYLLNNFTLASASDGNLSLHANGDIIGQVANGYGGYQSAQILVSDMAEANWYGLFYVGYPGSHEETGGWLTARTAGNRHGLYNPIDQSMSIPAAGPLHSGDSTPIEIAAEGDVKDLNLMFPKKAEVTAGGNIVDITYDGQNINPDDVSMIQAGGDISVQSVKASSTAIQGGLIQGGPGTFLVQAGGSIDLGSLAEGIQAVGDGNNPALGTGKSSLIVLSGYDPSKAVDVVTFFDELRQSGDLYSLLLAGGSMADAEKLVNSITTQDAQNVIDELRAKAGSEDAFYKMLTAGGNAEEANALLQATRASTIDLLKPSGAGDINMTSSQIATSNAASDIFVIANGNLNLGETAFPSPTVVNTSTGITTANGGTINIFSEKDVNVQESRIMTFFSAEDAVDPTISYGDITIWSNTGNINAGRGSTAAVNASPPKSEPVPGQPGVYHLVFTPPAVGSGIRALTYGPNPPKDAGNIHLFAPTGIIDAGEAGIAGSTVTLAALKVTNTANISFSAGSIGVPQQSTASSANVGTLSGSGIATQNTQLTSDVSGISMAKAQAAQLIEDIIAKWLDVKVIDFVEDDTDTKDTNSN